MAEPLPNGWGSRPLGDLVLNDGISYGVVQPGGDCVDGIPIIRVTDLRGGGVAPDDVKRIDPAVEAAYSRSRLRGGEVLLSLVGSIGEVAVVAESLAGWNVARAIGVIRPVPSVGAQWVAVCLRSPELRHLMSVWKTTTVQETLNLRDVARLPIVLPPPGERNRILGLLSALDDKIELSRRMNETLERMSESIFRDLTSGADRRSAADEFVITMGQSPPGETYNETGDGLPFFQGRADFGFRYPSQRVYCTAPTRLAFVGDTLVSVRAPVGDVNMALVDCAVGRGVAAVRHRSGSRSFTYYSMRGLHRAFEVFESEGTVFGSLSKTDFHRIEVPAVPEVERQRFEGVVGPLDRRIEVNERQSRTLAALRDALLPKLISGELRIRDAERAVEQAT